MKVLANIVRFQVAESHAARGILASNRNIVIDPPGERRPKTASGQNRERVRREKIDSRQRAQRRRLLAVEVGIPFVPKPSGHNPWDLAWKNRIARKGLSLCLRT